MRSSKLFLVGPMGSGKSSLARLVARRLGWDSVDLDREIEKRADRTVEGIFQEEGEQGFRDREEAALATLVEYPRPLVVATGGGAVVRRVNRTRMREGGSTVYLRAPPEILLKRVGGKGGRPLLQVSDPLARLSSLLEEREPLYREADRIVDTEDRDPEELARDLAGWMAGGPSGPSDEVP